MNKIIHQIWLGGNPPEKYKKYMDSVVRKNPEWSYKLWTDRDIPSDFICNRVKRIVSKSDVMRVELIQRFGGIYLDCDVRCTKPIGENFNDDKLHFMKFNANFPEVCVIICSDSAHPFFKTYLDNLDFDAIEDLSISPLDTTGNFYVGNLLKEFSVPHEIDGGKREIFIHHSGKSWIPKDNLWQKRFVNQKGDSK